MVERSVPCSSCHENHNTTTHTIVHAWAGEAHAGLRPYRKGPTNWLKACIEIQIFLTLLISLVTRFADKLATDVMDVAGYEWLVVVTFVLVVPVALCVLLYSLTLFHRGVCCMQVRRYHRYRTGTWYM